MLPNPERHVSILLPCSILQSCFPYFTIRDDLALHAVCLSWHFHLSWLGRTHILDRQFSGVGSLGRRVLPLKGGESDCDASPFRSLTHH
jgi:hypothetical protein